MKYALITGLFISSIFAEVNTTKIKVDGMQCSYSCAGKVNSVVQKIDGVKESSVDFAKAKHNEVVKIQGLAKLGLNENNDLKRAIIINEILSKPRAMKKNIR